jgi:diguanylate cyclase (GGDEF)-like protein/PAS domain S-box-containing protein
VRSDTPRKSRDSEPSSETAAVADDVDDAPSETSAVILERFAALEVVGQRSQDLMLIVDAMGNVQYANPICLETFGVSLEDGVGTSAFNYIHPDDAERAITEFLTLLETPSGTFRDTIRAIDANGDVRELELVSTNALDNVAVAGVIVNGRDVTEHNKYVSQLQELEQRFRLAFEDNMAPMIFTDLEDRVIAANDAFCKMIGFEREEILGRDSTPFTYPEDFGISEDSHRRVTEGETHQSRYVKRYLRKDGRLIYVEVLRSPARDADGKILYNVISERDITDERTLAAQLSHQALHDTLTGLSNRALFDDRLDQARAKMLREGGYCAVLLLDLDDFKGVNDSLGHLAGDQLLISVARRLEQVARESDTLCRFGGDEFLYLAEGLSSADDASLVATRLLDSLAEPFIVAGNTIEQRASIGIVVTDNSLSDRTEFLQDADVALYEAKRLGKGRFALFTSSMHQQAVNHFTLVQELRQALQTGNLAMHYQPIFDLQSGRIVGLEALMRWNHPTRGWVPPDVFIPAAEQSDLILDLGHFALRDAISAVRSWKQRSEYASDLFVTVNLSARQFHDPDLLSTIEEALGEDGLSRQRLVIEITESVTFLNVTDTKIVMEQLNNLGISFALDDFGTGFSSLSYLALLHPEIIKVDRSFVSPSEESSRNDVLLEAIISLGHKLNMTVLGEGIETASQRDRVRSFGCELGQGFLWSPAIPSDDVPTLLNDQTF